MARTLEYEIVLDGTPEEVWKLLSTADGITRWFAPEARAGDGKVWISWGPGMEGEGTVHLSEPGKSFGWIENGPHPKTVEFYLEGEGGKTKLRLVQSGLGEGSDFDAEYDAVNGGWRTFIGAMAHGLRHHPRSPHQQVAKMTMVKGKREDIVAKASTVLGFPMHLQALAVGAQFAAELPGLGRIEGERLDPDKAGYFLLTLDNWDKSAVGLFFEVFGDSLAVTQQWFLFGAGREKAEALREALPKWLEQLS
jgi:uncharacterized protein YndB with AHSA1/START domain